MSRPSEKEKKIKICFFFPLSAQKTFKQLQTEGKKTFLHQEKDLSKGQRRKTISFIKSKEAKIHFFRQDGGPESFQNGRRQSLGVVNAHVWLFIVA